MKTVVISSQRITVEAYEATNKVCQNRSWKAFMKQATDIIDQMKLCDTVFIYCDADQKMEIEKIGNNAIKLTVKEI